MSFRAKLLPFLFIVTWLCPTYLPYVGLMIFCKAKRYYVFDMDVESFFFYGGVGNIRLGAVHKRRPQLGGRRGLSSANIFRTTGRGSSSDVDVGTFWCKNHRVFRNLWCVRTDKRDRVEKVRTFCGQGRRGGSIFRDIVRTSFMNGPL